MGTQVYQRVWLTGRDANLFDAQIVDDDDDPANGFKYTITDRPSAAGRQVSVPRSMSSRGVRCRQLHQTRV